MIKAGTIMSCVVAGTILATTMSIANSADLKLGIASRHAKGHHSSRVASFSHHRRLAHRSHRVRAVAGLSHRHHFSEGARAPRTSDPQSGIASVYSGGRTANGEHASANRLTAAHRSLPFGTMVMVTCQHTGRSVVVRINDRGPFVHGRVIDVTPAAARALGFSGLASVTLTVMARG
jgi:rare lipoprotein A